MNPKRWRLDLAKPNCPNGQSMLEVAVAIPFLLLLVIALVEMGVAFASYAALINGAREGAMFASMCPSVTDSSKDTDTYFGYHCAPPKQNIREYRDRVNNDIVTPLGQELVAGQIQLEDAACNSGDPFWGYVRCLKVDRPIKAATCTTCCSTLVCCPAGPPCCPTGLEPGCPITVTVHYRLRTFTSDISLPVPRVKGAVPGAPWGAPPGSAWTNWFFSVLGNVDWSTGWRMGLPNYYQLDYTVGMPIR